MRLVGAARRLEEAIPELCQSQQSGLWAVINWSKQSRWPQLPEPTRDRQTNVFLPAACLLISAFSLWLRSGFPAAATSYWIDEVLFVKLAKNLSFGQWLGQYGCRFDRMALRASHAKQVGRSRPIHVARLQSNFVHHDLARVIREGL
jgi:hypothetical protein